MVPPPLDLSPINVNQDLITKPTTWYSIGKSSIWIFIIAIYNIKLQEKELI